MSYVRRFVVGLLFMAVVIGVSTAILLGLYFATKAVLPGGDWWVIPLLAALAIFLIRATYVIGKELGA